MEANQEGIKRICAYSHYLQGKKNILWEILKKSKDVKRKVYEATRTTEVR